MLFLRPISEACRMFMSAQVSSESHWLSCLGSHFLEITTQLTDDIRS